MINFFFKDDTHAVVVEVQIFHDLMMKARGSLGGHKDYEVYRSIFEIFECVKSNDTRIVGVVTPSPKIEPEPDIALSTPEGIFAEGERLDLGLAYMQTINEECVRL